ncbi:MAG: hypothetical protein ACR2OU_14515 [Thermomicrobiales bacterium]
MDKHTIDSTAATASIGQDPARDTASIVPGPPDQEQAAAIHMPAPSIWPIVSAFGITMIGFGFLTRVEFWMFGVIVLIVSLWGWIGEMRHE